MSKGSAHSMQPGVKIPDVQWDTRPIRLARKRHMEAVLEIAAFDLVHAASLLEIPIARLKHLMRHLGIIVARL